MNERVMMFGAIILSIIAIVLGGYAFGEVRSLGNTVENQRAQIEAVEGAQAEGPQAPEGMEELQAQVDQLSAEVAELSEQINRISQAFEAIAEPQTVDEPEAEQLEGEEEQQQ